MLILERLGLTRARVTQLLDLTLLAPDIQEKILFAESVDGAELVSERKLRWLAREDAWSTQRTAFLDVQTGWLAKPDLKAIGAALEN